MIYIVAVGDTVDSIAKSYGIPVDMLIYDNQLEYPYRLAVGESLYLRTDMKKTIYVNGYAYPFIEHNILEETLDYLTTLSVFSYGFTPEGELIEPEVSDAGVIEAALRHGVGPVLTLTPLDAGGRFNNNLIHSILISKNGTDALIGNLLNVAAEKGYRGIDVDFEYILPEDRDMFTGFVARLTEVMNDRGYTVSVALAPKTSAGQKGLLYEGKDYKGLGEAANSVLLMTYEWGYTYSEPRAVAPVNLVRRVIEYALTEIPSEKIDMGIPNYGYDWRLPYIKGETKATTIGNVQAAVIAADYGAEILYDDIAQTPHFTYENEGIMHEVWFEDARSIKAKLELVEEYDLRGVGYWQIMRLFRDNWLELSDMYEIRAIV